MYAIEERKRLVDRIARRYNGMMVENEKPTASHQRIIDLLNKINAETPMDFVDLLEVKQSHFFYELDDMLNDENHETSYLLENIPENKVFDSLTASIAKAKTAAEKIAILQDAESEHADDAMLVRLFNATLKGHGDPDDFVADEDFMDSIREFLIDSNFGIDGDGDTREDFRDLSQWWHDAMGIYNEEED